MKERFRIFDELLEVMHGLFLRPKLWVSTPEACEAFFLALLTSIDITCDNDYKLRKAYMDFKRPQPNCLPPSNYMSISELIKYFRGFHDQHIIVKFKNASPISLGPIPVRQEIEVLPADDAKQLKLGWTVHEYIGCPVYKWGSDDQPWPNRLRKEEDLQIGDKICFSWNAAGWSYKVIGKNEDGSMWGESGNTKVVLRFNDDDRKCWTTFGFINMRGITRMSKETK